MPGALAAACGLAALITHSSASEPIWRLAASGESCDDACGAEGGAMKCTSGHWPTDPASLLKITTQVAWQCSSTNQKDSRLGPAVYAYGDCFYPASSDVDCALKPPEHFRRLCPCNSDEMRYILSDEGSTCSEACSSRGGVCQGSPDKDWPLNLQDMQFAVRQAGGQCDSVDASDRTHTPYIAEGRCYWAATKSLIHCDTYHESHKRICPCLGASPNDPGSSGKSGSGKSGSDKSTPSKGSGGLSHIPRAATCRDGFERGQMKGGTQTKLFNIYMSEGSCKQAVADQYQNSNGATYSEGLGECWANIGMSGYDTDPTLKTCWFKDPLDPSGGHSGSSSHGTSSSASSHGAPGVSSKDCVGGAFRQGKSNGGQTHKLDSTYSSAEACMYAAKKDGSCEYKKANGVTFSSALGECLCNIGMIGFAGEPTMTTCWYADNTDGGTGTHSGSSESSTSTGTHSGSSSSSSSSSSRSSSSGGTTSGSFASGCRDNIFQPGQTASLSGGGRQHKLATTYPSAELCKGAASSEPKCKIPGHVLNGVTYSSGLGECWCNIGMSGYDPEPTMETCWFPSKSHSSRQSRAIGSWWSLGGLVPKQSVVPQLAVGMFAAAVAGGAIAGLFVWRRLSVHIGSAECIGNTLLHNESE